MGVTFACYLKSVTAPFTPTTMLHFPSSTNVAPKRMDSLNATQKKMGSNPILMKIEEELHDVRRVQIHGQEEDLRLALDMVINRVTELVWQQRIFFLLYIGKKFSHLF
jgi:hypothetical protein